DRLVPIGNTTEGALLLWLHAAGSDYRDMRLRFEPLYQIHFSSERKRMTSVIRLGDRLVALVKGAPEWVLGQCTEYLATDGSARTWTPELRARVGEVLRDMTRRSMRALAFGHAVLPADTSAAGNVLHMQPAELERGLVYAGLVAIADPLRADAKEAVQRCRNAGIEVKMITGDSIETARSISAEIGLVEQPNGKELRSAEFNALSDEELKQRLPRLRVLARALPLDKLRLVGLLQEEGEVVAVTGDGTNDAPALKKADVGLSMGRTG